MTLPASRLPAPLNRLPFPVIASPLFIISRSEEHTSELQSH